MTKRIIQPDTYSCFACVAAMITGDELNDVVRFVGHDGSYISADSTHPDGCAGFGQLEITKYLLSHNYILGTWARLDDGIDLSQYGHINLEIDIKDLKAIIIVESKRLEKCHHVIYWDGKQLFDPSPEAKSNPDLSEYKAFEFIPVSLIME